MLIETVGGAKILPVKPPDRKAQPEKSEDAVASQRQAEAKQEAAEITQEMLDVVGENLKMIHDLDLRISIHEPTGRIAVKVINGDTGELVREIPPEQILNLAAKIDEMIGILFDRKV